jgi:hypothetical protein
MKIIDGYTTVTCTNLVSQKKFAEKNFGETRFFYSLLFRTFKKSDQWCVLKVTFVCSYSVYTSTYAYIEILYEFLAGAQTFFFGEIYYIFLFRKIHENPKKCIYMYLHFMFEGRA